MAYALPEDIEKRAAEKLRHYPYLELQDPGTVLQVDGKVLVFVLDQERRPLWLEV
ncbi:MAG: hypothetical protein ACRD5K_09590 [Candidatus Acidiferrales bacterium]